MQSGNILFIRRKLEEWPRYTEIISGLDRWERPEKFSSRCLPDGNTMALARFIKGEARAFRVAFGGECDRISGPGYDVCFVGGKVDKTDKAVWETLDTVPGCIAPD
jgi:hypothetical protein